MLEICRELPNASECYRLRNQLSGAGVSVAANYEEGNGALTKKEKRKSFSVSRKEAREARVILRLISGPYLPPEEVEKDIQEAGEIVKIFSTIIQKLS